MKRKLLCRMICLLMCLPSFSMAQGNVDIDTIKRRLVAIYMQGATHLPVPQPVHALLASITAEGKWDDLDYAEKPKVNLPSIAHVSRLVKMAIAYRSSNDRYYNNKKILAAIHAGLAYWFKAAPQSQNNWYNVIGVPTELVKVMVLMDDELTFQEMKDGLTVLKRCNQDGILYYGRLEATGQNMIWEAKVQLQAGCFEKDTSYISFAAKKIAGEIVVTTKEGIQPDWSFHQHGPQLYSGGYGLGFSLDCAQLSTVLHSTKYALSDTVINTISHYILDGQQWMVWGNKIDYATMGREIARVNKTAMSLALACDYMVQLNTARRKEFAALSGSIKQNLVNSSLIGNHAFPYSDFMLHRTSNDYVSVKLSSTRTFASESGNGEAEQNYHIGTGSMFIMRTGKEYENIFPLWNWQKIPGLTNRIRRREDTLPLITFGKAAIGKTDFVGTVSDGKTGLAAFDLNRDSVQGKKAWFFFGNETVCLGTGIKSFTQEPLVTTVNQCIAKGDIWYGIDGKQSTSTKIPSNIDWLCQDSTAYIIEPNQKVHVSTEKKTASWSVINRFMANPPTESAKVFSLWLEHDNAATNQYAYAIVPSIGNKHVQAYCSNKPWKVLMNSSMIQAVQHRQNNCLQMVFWQAGSIESTVWGKVRVDKPCLLMLKEVNGVKRLSLSNPLKSKLEVKVQIGLLEKSYQLPSDGTSFSTTIQSPTEVK